MSSRLKRKLNDLGVDVASLRANENFCLIGTPLPPLEKSKDTGEFVPLWKQEVRDEKGRRRLHGAFTGGFSAGYFNTVGSKEGWTPSTFVSSRADRAKAKLARPEDFMDEEDLQELRDSKTIVDTTQEMDLTAGTMARGGDDTEQDSIVHALQSTLLPTPNDSVGARILKKMGWRLGNGIGPRVSLRQRRLQDLQASSPYGTRAVIQDVKLTEDDEEADKHAYAPRDTPVLVVERKDNAHGIGYQSGITLHESVGSSKKATTKGPRISAGFGLGALNDADEDDLDVYDAESKTTRNQLAYDAQHHKDTVTLGGRGSALKTDKGSTALHPTVFHDGTRVLSGFVLSERTVLEDRMYPLPEIPPGWQPNPSRVRQDNKENIPGHEIDLQEKMPHNKWKSSGMTAGERGTMLGEAPLQSEPRSVFDYLSEKDRERLKAASAGVSSNLPLVPTPFSMPRTEPHIAEAALKGFQPFTSEPAKQERYTRYLQSQINSDAPPLQALQNQSLDEFQKEVEDYAKAATIFKPVSGAMAGRFQSATHVEQGPKIYEGLHQPTTEELDALEEKRKKEEEDKLSPQAHAAKLGMYGPMTREVASWQPARLLCKRFGLKEPEIPLDDQRDSSTTKGPSFTTSEAEEAFRQTTDVDSTTQTSSSAQYPGQSDMSGPRNLANIGLGEDETQGRDTLTYQRPAMDIFKAIFASDTEDSEDEKAESGVLEEEKEKEMPVNGVSATVSHSVLDEAPVDLSTFKPTFVPRGGKAKAKDEDRNRARKERKEKKERRKRDKRGTLVSFDVEESDGEQPSLDVFKEPPKRRKLHNHKRMDDDEDAMWVEKPPPDIVKSSSAVPMSSSQVAHTSSKPLPTVSATVTAESNETDAGARKGRKRAIDFM